MTRSTRLRLLGMLAALALLTLYLGPPRGPAEPLAGPGAPGSPLETPLPRAPVGRPAVGFRSAQDLVEHHARHAAEFGGISVSEYLGRAQSLRDRPAGGEVLELVRADGVITRFDRATGDFLAVNPDGTIRTFFRPNAGEVYFRRQAQRRSDSP